MEVALRRTWNRATAKGDFVAAALFLGLAHPWVRTGMEATLTGHMLVQIPMLAACGWIVGKNRTSLKRHPVSALLVALFAALFWMIPRWLDAALTHPEWETAKFVSVPLLVGLPLGMCWPRLTPLVKGFVWANGISMLAVLGWLYLVAPLRVCNNYLVNQQETFGLSAMFASAAIAAYWIATSFFGEWSNPEQGEER